MPRLAKRISRVRLGILTALAGSASGNARAQVPAQGSEIDEVTVLGERGPRGTAGFVSSASLDDAPREVTDAASLIEPLPGVHVRRLGADDSFASLSIRGSTSTQVAVLLAGVPLTGGADPSLDLASLPLWPGARVRVYRSFAPGGLGPGSLGGTLVVEPPSADSRNRSEVWAGFVPGSFGGARMRVADVRALGEANAGGGPGGSTANARVATALSASRADDAFTYFDPTASSPGQDVYATRANAGHAAANGLVSVVIPIGGWGGTARTENATLTVTTLLQARRQNVPGTILQPTPAQRLASNRELASIALTAPAPRGEWGWRAWGRRDQLSLSDRPTNPGLGPAHTDDSILAAGGAWSWAGALGSGAPRTSRASRFSLAAQIDGSGERYAPGTHEWAGAVTPPGATRASVGGALDAEWRATPAWTWTASGRADGWNDTTDDGSSTSGAAPSSTHVEVRPTGHVGTEVRAGPVVLSAHGGTVARPPSFVERYGNRGEFIGDPRLLPESAWTVDAGGRVASDRTGAVRGRAQVVLFGTWANDLIVFVPQGAYGQARATNIGRARMLGVEAEAAASGLGFELRVAYTGMATEDDSACAAVTGSIVSSAGCNRPALHGRPANDFALDLAYTVGPVRVRWGMDALSGMIADSVGAILVPARVLSSAGVRLQVPGVRGLRIAVDARNIFDVRTATYEGALGPVREPIGDAYAYPLPGRSFLATVRWEAGGPEE